MFVPRLHSETSVQMCLHRVLFCCPPFLLILYKWFLFGVCSFFYIYIYIYIYITYIYKLHTVWIHCSFLSLVSLSCFWRRRNYEYFGGVWRRPLWRWTCTDVCVGLRVSVQSLVPPLEDSVAEPTCREGGREGSAGFRLITREHHVKYHPDVSCDTVAMGTPSFPADRLTTKDSSVLTTSMLGSYGDLSRLTPVARQKACCLLRLSCLSASFDVGSRCGLLRGWSSVCLILVTERNWRLSVHQSQSVWKLPKLNHPD